MSHKTYSDYLAERYPPDVLSSDDYEKVALWRCRMCGEFDSIERTKRPEQCGACGWHDRFREADRSELSGPDGRWYPLAGLIRSMASFVDDVMHEESLP